VQVSFDITPSLSMGDESDGFHTYHRSNPQTSATYDNRRTITFLALRQIGLPESPQRPTDIETTCVPNLMNNAERTP
jgi:hypothetical protein